MPLMTRRDVIQAGLTGFGLAALPGSSGVATPQAEVSQTIQAAIVDLGIPQSLAFGIEARLRGVPVLEFKGDITELWFHDLDPHWRRKPMAIAGVTAHGPLFCLERLAWSHGMRVISRTSDTSGDEEIYSWLIAPA